MTVRAQARTARCPLLQYCNLCVPQRLQEEQDINQNNIASFALHLLYHWNSSEDVSTLISVVF